MATNNILSVRRTGIAPGLIFLSFNRVAAYLFFTNYQPPLTNLHGQRQAMRTSVVARIELGSFMPSTLAVFKIRPPGR